MYIFPKNKIVIVLTNNRALEILEYKTHTHANTFLTSYQQVYVFFFCLFCFFVDCDPDDKVGCATSKGLVCGVDNCAKFHALGADTGFDKTADCCEKAPPSMCGGDVGDMCSGDDAADGGVCTSGDDAGDVYNGDNGDRRHACAVVVVISVIKKNNSSN